MLQYRIDSDAFYNIANQYNLCASSATNRLPGQVHRENDTQHFKFAGCGTPIFYAIRHFEIIRKDHSLKNLSLIETDSMFIRSLSRGKFKLFQVPHQNYFYVLQHILRFVVITIGNHSADIHHFPLECVLVYRSVSYLRPVVEKFLRKHLYTERDKRCLDEHPVYERKPKGSYGAIAGKHDNLLMTRAIGLYICFYEMDMPRLINRSQSKLRKRKGSVYEAVF